uniref:protein capicua homolog n=1 Tax=Pristiophorus japonicus TaxID=55135 RepID=UPI00398F13AA
IFAPVIQLSSQSGSYASCQLSTEGSGSRDRPASCGEGGAGGAQGYAPFQPAASGLFAAHSPKPRPEQHQAAMTAAGRAASAPARRGDVRFTVAEPASPFDRKRRKNEGAEPTGGRPYPGQSVIAPLALQLAPEGGEGGAERAPGSVSAGRGPKPPAGTVLVSPQASVPGGALACPAPTSVTNVLRPVTSAPLPSTPHRPYPELSAQPPGSGGRLACPSLGIGVLYAPPGHAEKKPSPQLLNFSPLTKPAQGAALMTNLVMSSPSYKPPAQASSSSSSCPPGPGLVLPQQSSLQFIAQAPSGGQNGALPLGIIQPQQLKPSSITQLQYILPTLPQQLQVSPAAAAGKGLGPSAHPPPGTASIQFALPPPNGKVMASTQQGIPIIQPTSLLNTSGTQKAQSMSLVPALAPINATQAVQSSGLLPAAAQVQGKMLVAVPTPQVTMRTATSTTAACQVHMATPPIALPVQNGAQQASK